MMLHGTLMYPGIQIEDSRFKVETRALAIKKDRTFFTIHVML